MPLTHFTRHARPRVAAAVSFVSSRIFRLQSAKQELAQIEADLRRAREDARRKKHPVTEADRAAWLALPQEINHLDRFIAECQVIRDAFFAVSRRVTHPDSTW